MTRTNTLMRSDALLVIRAYETTKQLKSFLFMSSGRWVHGNKNGVIGTVTQ